MGIIRPGIPEDIVLYFKKTYDITSFIETGTYKGGTSLWASKYFQNVHTVEFSEIIYQQAQNNLKNIKNVNAVFGDSRKFLKDLIVKNIEPSIFWLDAHWSVGDTYGEGDECPLLDELYIINSKKNKHIILVDDARFFLTPPPRPHNIHFFPDIKEIIDCLDEQFIMVFEDVIMIIPELYKDSFSEFMQSKTTQEFQEYLVKSKEIREKEQWSKLRQTKHLIGNILRVWNLR